MNTLQRTLASLAALILLAACASSAASPTAEPLTLTKVEPPAPAEEPVAFACPITPSISAPAPDDPNADAFGNGLWFINADRTVWFPADGWQVGGNKAVWIRPAGTQGEITGRRLDGDAPPVSYTSPRGSYPTGFEVGGLTFPSNGCWEVTATAGESALTFVVEIGTSTQEVAELFFVRPEGARGPLVAYDAAIGREQFRLPAGLLSADGQRFIAVESGRMTVYELTRGQPLKYFQEHEVGDWELGALSPTGHSAVFSKVGTATYADGAAKTTTSFKVVNTVVGETQHELHLEGYFEVDALSANGKSLFLLERLSGDQSDQYVIRLYDLSQESLLADPIRSKGSDEVMAGYAWNGVGTPDGEWLLTLYLSTRRNVAFVHALNLKNQFAICIELPSGDGDFEKLKQYSLTLAPDGKKLYTANTALGVVAEVSLDMQSSVPAVTRRANFPAQAQTPGRVAISALSKDGLLYFTNGEDVWPYATKTGAVFSPYRVAGPIIGLGTNWDGKRLFVVRADQEQPVLVLDTASGQPLSRPDQ